MSESISPVLSLAFSTHSSPGVYAVLLGSGISRPSGILTGWEIVLDLIRKLAILEGEDCEPDPAGWYLARSGQEADYSNLLGVIAKSPAERSQLLRAYFEPTEEEREQGLKMPTEAHKAIADLVSGGYVRVIITTNFDRLLEKALEELGITPTVISTADAAEGSLPITHTKCTIIKVNGDYLDSRIRNTTEELSAYDDRLNELLDRVLDEFGLIVCGWSAEWDTALRAAIERCKSRRFTTYWATRTEPGDQAKRLTSCRGAQRVEIADANSFFRGLADKIHALEDIATAHPLTTKVAAALVKRYIVEESSRIRLSDLVVDEAERLAVELTETQFAVSGGSPGPDEFLWRVQQYEALVSTMLAILTTGCYWGNSTNEKLWVSSFERIAKSIGRTNGLVVWLELANYPVLLLLYSAGISSLLAENYTTLAALLTRVMVRGADRTYRTLVLAVNAHRVSDAKIWQTLPGLERHHTPVSDRLFLVLHPPLERFVSSDEQYEAVFDRFEYLLALVHADLFEKQGRGAFGPVGRFGWRNRVLDSSATVMAAIESEITTAGNDWPLLKAGLFDGSLSRVQQIKADFDRSLSRLPWF